MAIVRARYRLRIRPPSRSSAELLHRNILRFGTITNTLAAACELTGTIGTEPRAKRHRSNHDPSPPGAQTNELRRPPSHATDPRSKKRSPTLAGAGATERVEVVGRARMLERSWRYPFPLTPQLETATACECPAAIVPLEAV